jgi:hypothetical protein
MHRYERQSGLQFIVHLNPELFVTGKMAAATDEWAVAHLTQNAGLREPFPHLFDQAVLGGGEQKPHNLQAKGSGF